MEINGVHLTYCTNIHPGKTWNSHFEELRKHVPGIRKGVSPNARMGLGLRLGNRMSLDLMDPGTLEEFRAWLEENQLYVFTLNGFPYGNFHHAVIKDQVHSPDWTTTERFEYTLRLFDILAKLLPEDLKQGGISTSPLSYRHWFRNESDAAEATELATQRIVETAEYLHGVYRSTGVLLHLDIEPEPDGLIENGDEFIHWYEETLLPTGRKMLTNIGLKQEESDRIMRRHIQLCYDVCHMAVEYEDQRSLISKLRDHQILIGKIQLSSALRLHTTSDPKILLPFSEPQYLHQVVMREDNGILHKFTDLPHALQSGKYPDAEWRIHFHVPIFTTEYGELSSTRNYIDEILKIHGETPLTTHFELETYTWEVLPDAMRLPIEDSIIREFESVVDNF